MKEHLKRTVINKKENFTNNLSVFASLPTYIKYNIGINIYNKAYEKVHILNESSKEFISNIVPRLYSKQIIKNEYVYYCDQVPDSGKYTMFIS